MENDFEKWLKDNSITEVECLVPDLGGIARGKILPTNKFINGLKYKWLSLISIYRDITWSGGLGPRAA